MLQVGDYVKHKETGVIAKVNWSSFGFSLHYRNEQGLRCKTLGEPSEHILKYWDKCTPDGELL